MPTFSLASSSRSLRISSSCFSLMTTLPLLGTPALALALKLEMPRGSGGGGMSSESSESSGAGGGGENAAEFLAFSDLT